MEEHIYPFLPYLIFFLFFFLNYTTFTLILFATGDFGTRPTPLLPLPPPHSLSAAVPVPCGPSSTNSNSSVFGGFKSMPIGLPSTAMINYGK